MGELDPQTFSRLQLFRRDHLAAAEPDQRALAFIDADTNPALRPIRDRRRR
jgi:hypothetical protein